MVILSYVLSCSEKIVLVFMDLFLGAARKILISPEEFLQHSHSKAETLIFFLYMIPWLLLNSKVLHLISQSLLNLTAPANTF